MAERYRPEDMVVILGTPNAESTRLYALTVAEGDPAWAGALAGVGLGLPAYHITEEPVKRLVAPEAYEEHVALMEVVLDVESITKAAQEVRSSAGHPAS